MDNRILLFTSDIFKWSFSLFFLFRFPFILHSSFFIQLSHFLSTLSSLLSFCEWSTFSYGLVMLFERNSIVYLVCTSTNWCAMLLLLLFSIHFTVFVDFANENGCAWYWRFSLPVVSLLNLVFSVCAFMRKVHFQFSLFFPSPPSALHTYNFMTIAFVFSQFDLKKKFPSSLHASLRFPFEHHSVLFLIICLFCVQSTLSEEDDDFRFFSPSFYSLLIKKEENTRTEKSNRTQKQINIYEPVFIPQIGTFMDKWNMTNKISKYRLWRGAEQLRCLTMMGATVFWMCCLFDEVRSVFILFFSSIWRLLFHSADFWADAVYW